MRESEGETATIRRTGSLWTSLLLAVVSLPVHAQQPPTAGDVLRDVGEKASPVPPPKAPPSIEVAPETRRVVKPLPGFKIDVKGFRFTGLTVVPEQDLQPLVRKYLGSDRTFDELQAAADAVSAELRRRGYFVARAFLPEQKVESGLVEIAVLEGRLGEVRIDMDERSPVKRTTLARLFSTLERGTILHEDTIERVLFIASDLRGITIRSVIEPGAVPGTADLIVKVEPSRRVDVVLGRHFRRGQRALH